MACFSWISIQYDQQHCREAVGRSSWLSWPSQKATHVRENKADGQERHVMAICGNPKFQRAVAIKLGISLKCVNRFIHEDLCLAIRKECKVYKLLPRHIRDRPVVGGSMGSIWLEKNTNSWSLDESPIHLADFSKTRAIYCQQKCTGTVEPLYLERAECFSPGFMLVAAVS